jgi:hypothetical protein
MFEHENGIFPFRICNSGDTTGTSVMLLGVTTGSRLLTTDDIGGNRPGYKITFFCQRHMVVQRNRPSCSLHNNGSDMHIAADSTCDNKLCPFLQCYKPIGAPANGTIHK